MSFEVVRLESVNVRFPYLKPVIFIEDKKYLSTELDKVNVSLEKKKLNCSLTHFQLSL